METINNNDMKTPKLLRWHDDGYPPFNNYRDFDNIRELITYAAELRKKVELLQSQPKQLSDEEIEDEKERRFPHKTNGSEYQAGREDGFVEGAHWVKARTGGGVDLPSEVTLRYMRECLSSKDPWNPEQDEKAREWINTAITQRNQQED